MKKRTPIDWRVVQLYFWLLGNVLQRIDKYTAEEGECVVWQARTCGKAKRPMLAMPFKRMHKLQRVLGDRFVPSPAPEWLHVRALLIELAKRGARGNAHDGAAVAECGCLCCVSPSHGKFVPAGRAIQMGIGRRLPALRHVHAQKLAEAVKHIRKLPDADCDAIRAAPEHVKSVELARQYGVSAQHVRLIRRGLRRVPLPQVTPFSGLGAMAAD